MDSAEKDTFQAEFCAARLKALADSHRLRIVDLLRHGEMTVTDIANFLEVEVVNASHHLQILKNAQVVVPRREGKYIYYALHPDLLQSAKKSQQYLDLGCCRLEVPS